MNREDAKQVFKKLAACYPNWKIDTDIALVWIEELEQADSEHVFANVKEYIRENKFPPTLHDIIKPNHRVEAKREIDATKKYIDQRNEFISTTPPWVKRGMSKACWLREIMEEARNK